MLARLEVTGGSIRTIAVNAAFRAAAPKRAGRDGARDGGGTARVRQADRLVTPAEFGDWA